MTEGGILPQKCDEIFEDRQVHQFEFRNDEDQRASLALLQLIVVDHESTQLEVHRFTVFFLVWIELNRARWSMTCLPRWRRVYLVQLSLCRFENVMDRRVLIERV